jgi:TPR repeat protein
MIKAGAGLMAGVLAGGLGYAFWPKVEPSVLSARPAVEKPVFVVATEPSRPISSPIALPTVAVPLVSSTDKNDLVKLAAAFRSDGGKVGSAPTRSVTEFSAKSPNNEAARLCAQGLVAFADGDIAGARAFLERAADAGDPRALMVLGDTYDPSTLTRMGALGLKGDAKRAHDYYARALAAGLGDARQRIFALDSSGK